VKRVVADQRLARTRFAAHVAVDLKGHMPRIVRASVVGRVLLLAISQVTNSEALVNIVKMLGAQKSGILAVSCKPNDSVSIGLALT